MQRGELKRKRNFELCISPQRWRSTSDERAKYRNIRSDKSYILENKWFETSKNVNIKIWRTIILPVVLYGCETWSLTLREECRLWVFENTVLRRILGPKKDEVTKEWRRLHNEELHALHSSPNIARVTQSRRLRWARQVARLKERRI